jgi:xeroderma pigmentosum group C-complementing protein
MLPQGAVHIPYRGTAKICKRLGIDFAEAVTGFEFGHRMAVPIITGVVVAEEHYENMMAEFAKDEAERVRKEDEKRRKLILHTWGKFLRGMRIIERFRLEHGDDAGDEVDALNPWTNKKKAPQDDKNFEAQRRLMEQRDEDNAGGFFPEGHEEEEPDSHHPSTFFPGLHNDEDETGGGFIVEGHDEEPAKPAVGAYATPQSPQSNGKLAASHLSDEHKEAEDEEMEDLESEPEVEAPAPKKRGRPSGSTNKAPKCMPTPKVNGKAKTPAKGISSKRKRQVDDTEDDDVSSLSELQSEDVDSEVEAPPKKVAKKAARRATMPAKSTSTPRKTPRRNAARKSETAVRSHYFANSGEEVDG